MPKSALKLLGLKAEVDEAGEVEIVEREGAEVEDMDARVMLAGGLDERVAAFVDDLLEDDEDEVRHGRLLG